LMWSHVGIAPHGRVGKEWQTDGRHVQKSNRLETHELCVSQQGHAALQLCCCRSQHPCLAPSLPPPLPTHTASNSRHPTARGLTVDTGEHLAVTRVDLVARKHAHLELQGGERDKRSARGNHHHTHLHVVAQKASSRKARPHFFFHTHAHEHI
jgi:hypothetical protein